MIFVAQRRVGCKTFETITKDLGTMTTNEGTTIRLLHSWTSVRFCFPVTRFAVGFLVLYTCFCSTLADATQLNENECENRPEPAVQLHGERLVVNEQNFPRYNSVYPPSVEETQDGSSDPQYFILNKEKSVLYVSNFLNETAANELKDMCIRSDRFTRSPIRGHGNDPSVSQSDFRTR
jgi:hypothetical protein